MHWFAALAERADRSRSSVDVDPAGSARSRCDSRSRSGTVIAQLARIDQFVRVVCAACSALALAGCLGGGGGGGSGDGAGSIGSSQNGTSSAGGNAIASPNRGSVTPNPSSGSGSSSNPAATGLDFPGSEAAGGTMRFQFTRPLAAYPATYVWRLYPRQQNGYYTTFFWGNNGSFLWNLGSPDTYYGAHPYPEVPPNGSTHRWEIAVGGGDFVSSDPVIYDAWVTQALVVSADGSGKHHAFYWDLRDPSKVVRRTEPASYGNTLPPDPVLVFGDAPWNPGHEVLNGILRGIQIYSGALSLAEIQAEIAQPASTSSGAARLWYLNLNPTPTDIADKSGRGNHPVWFNAARPGLWVGQ